MFQQANHVLITSIGVSLLLVLSFEVAWNYSSTWSLGEIYTKHDIPLKCAHVDETDYTYFPKLKARTANSTIPPNFWQSGQWNNSHMLDSVYYYGRLRDGFCGGDVHILYVVMTSSEDFEGRQGVRETWGSVKTFDGKNFEVVFLTALSMNADVNARLNEEMVRHADVVRLNYYDRKERMIFKAIMVHRFAVEHCPNAKYVARATEDVMFSHNKVLRFLAKYPENRTMFGCVISNLHDRPQPGKENLEFLFFFSLFCHIAAES